MGNVNRQSYGLNSYSQAMSTFGERLKEARTDKGLSQGALAKLVGVKQPTIAELEANGKGSSKVALFAKALSVNPVWLSEGKGSKSETTPSLVVHSFQKEEQDFITISQFNEVGASMGVGVLLAEQPGQITSWNVTKEWVAKNLPANTGANNLCIITGFGDSMKGKFNPGDPIVIDTGITECKHDGMYFFRVGDEGFVKTLQRIPGQGIRVISENKAYESWTITPDMDFQVLGKVLKGWEGTEY
jgi:phage repressor protein C with HTH and peptisase S24 domain